MKAFRCARTGMYFPEDYYENWGTKYGVGLGPVPVSEALVNLYDHPVAGEGDKAMHPVAHCQAQIDYVDVDETEYNKKKAIIAGEDPDMIQRAAIMKDKQIIKSPKMRQHHAGRFSELTAPKID